MATPQQRLHGWQDFAVSLHRLIPDQLSYYGTDNPDFYFTSTYCWRLRPYWEDYLQTGSWSGTRVDRVFKVFPILHDFSHLIMGIYLYCFLSDSMIRAAVGYNGREAPWRRPIPPDSQLPTLLTSHALHDYLTVLINTSLKSQNELWVQACVNVVVCLIVCPLHAGCVLSVLRNRVQFLPAYPVKTTAVLLIPNLLAAVAKSIAICTSHLALRYLATLPATSWTYGLTLVLVALVWLGLAVPANVALILAEARFWSQDGGRAIIFGGKGQSTSPTIFLYRSWILAVEAYRALTVRGIVQPAIRMLLAFEIAVYMSPVSYSYTDYHNWRDEWIKIRDSKQITI